MQQRYRRVVRVTLITACATLALSGLQYASNHVPPFAVLIWQIVFTASVGALYIRWQRKEWERALPRRASAFRVVVLVVVICLAVDWANHWSGVTSAVDNVRQTGEGWTRATVTLAATITDPLTQEALFRGYMLGRLRRSFGSVTSVLLSGGAFAVSQGDPARVLSQFVVGIVLGTLVVYTGRLWLAVVAHGLFNVVGLAEPLITLNSGPAQLGISFPLLCLAAAIVATLELHRVLTTTRWSIPIQPTARVALPLTWGIDPVR